MKQEELLSTFRNIIRRLFPELGDRTHLPHKAQVIAVHGEAGEVRADGLGSRRYSVDVEPLTPDGEPDPDRPTLLDVPLEVQWSGPGRGIFGLPAVGSVVRVAYYGGSAAHPYIDGIVPDGWSVPEVKTGELLLQHSKGTFLRLTPEGNVEIEGKQLKVTLTGQADVQAQSVTLKASGNVSVDGASVTLAGGGPPIARVGDLVAGGVIVKGSSRVTSG